MANWNFEDFLRRLEAIKELDSLEDLVKQEPGLEAILADVEFRLEDLEPIEKILRAMSPAERRDPELLEGEPGELRRERIARDSETSVEAVDSLIWQFRSLCSMLEAMSPEDVKQELLDAAQPALESWQTGGDSWKREAKKNTEEPADAEDPPQPEARQKSFNDQVDELLRKVHTQGLGCLLPEEREALETASRRYQARQERHRR